MNRSIVTVLAAALLGSTALAADPDRLIPYSGKLQVDTAFPGGSMDFTFTLYDAPTGGTSLWTRAQTVALNNGEFAVVFGDASGPALPESVFAASALYLELSIQATTLNPRQRIYAAPASVRANYATFRVADFLYLGPGQGAIESPGRLHLSTRAEDILLMAAKGVHITYDWGGNGALSVEGPTALNGGATASSLNVAGATTLTGGVSGNLNVTGTLTAATTNLGIVYPVCDGNVAWKGACACPPGYRILTGGVYCLSPSFVAYSYPDFATNVWYAGCALCASWGGDGCWGQTWIHLACAKIQ